eukprot:758601-Prymnesium_polylepis.1
MQGAAGATQGAGPSNSADVEPEPDEPATPTLRKVSMDSQADLSFDKKVHVWADRKRSDLRRATIAMGWRSGKLQALHPMFNLGKELIPEPQVEDTLPNR